MNIFKQYFERYLNARKSKNLFRRRSILESMPREKRQQRPSDTLNRRLLSEARLDLPQLLAQLGTSVQGLTDAEAEELLEQHGFNEVEHESAVRWWRHLWLSYNNPFNLLLTLLALVSIFTKDLQGAVVITVMVVLATLLRFFQERRSNQAAKALKERVSNTASVRRRASDSVEVSVRHLLEDTTEIPIKELVPGDIVHLSAGDMIPADCRLLTATDLFLSQSGMTGESLPVEKFVAVKSTTESALEMDNLVFMGTNVISGTASAVVLATGNSTYFGTLARRVTRAATADDINAFQLGVNKVSWLLIRFALIMVPLVLFINGFSKGDWDTDWKVKTVSLSAMDTVDLNDEWSVFGGLRYDRFEYDNTVIDRSAGALDYALEDGLWNGHAGISYTFRPDANVYFNYSTASDFNGGESDVGASCGYGGICVPSGTTAEERLRMFANSKPEKSQNFELGTKWNLMDGRLLASGAVFRTVKTDVMENATDDAYSSIGSINTGEYRVEGAELGLSGKLTDKLMVQAGVAVMNSEIRESQDPDNVGKGLSNFPEKTASLLLSYELTPKFTFGGGLTHSSEKYSGEPESAAATDLKVPAYTVYDLFASYRVSKDLTARLNIGNLTDEDYYTAAYRSGAFAYIGDARNVRLTLDYNF